MITSSKAALDYQALLASIVSSSADAIVSKDLNGIITSWNTAAEAIFGYAAEEIVGQQVTVLIPPDRLSEEEAILNTIKRGSRVNTFRTIRLRKDGAPVHISATISPIFDAAGNIIGASKIARDVTEWQRNEDIRTMLMREVVHRSKNMLALVEAIVRQTVRRSSPQDFAKRLSARLQSMAASQDLLVQENWAGVPIKTLVKNQLAYVDDLAGSRIVSSGPDLLLSPVGAQALGMALHELSTNALIFGALSTEHGQVDLRWNVGTGDTPRFTISWQETGGPPVTEPTEFGFGQVVLIRMTEATLHGKVTYAFTAEGVTWRLDTPLDAVRAA
ncbi:PAS domain S-box protein [Phreatobacter aquaticus]|nr:PAS domain S-box protein [Phreatobacter aquaticus]